jgi:hypothetical protein
MEIPNEQRLVPGLMPIAGFLNVGYSATLAGSKVVKRIKATSASGIA